MADPKQARKPVEITPELVRKVADAVYELMRRDMTYARERWRRTADEHWPSGRGRRTY